MLERLIRTMLGVYCVVVEVKLITKKGGAAEAAESKLMATRGALCALFPEPDARDKLNSGKVKQLTGEDGFQARELYGVAMESDVSMQIVVSCNLTVNVSETSEGMMRRPKIVPFLRKFLDRFQIKPKYNPYNPMHKIKDRSLMTKFKDPKVRRSSVTHVAR